MVAGSGVNVEELYNWGAANGYVTIGGYTTTVGAAGGYILGGGLGTSHDVRPFFSHQLTRFHVGPLVPLFGLGVDSMFTTPSLITRLLTIPEISCKLRLSPPMAWSGP